MGRRIDGEYRHALQQIANVFYGQGREPALKLAKKLLPNENPSRVVDRVVSYVARGRLSRQIDTSLPPPEETVEEMTAKDRRILKLEEEVRHLRKLYKEQTKQAAGYDGLIAAIHEVLPQLDTVRVPPPFEPSDELEVEQLVLLLGDLHFGEVVSAEETGGISSFNLDIAKRRFEYTIEKAIAIAKEKQRGFHYEKLNVFLLGDLISGLIHDELKENDEVAVVQQMLFAIEIISAGILRLCQEFPEVEVSSVVGNHGRVKEKYYFKGKANNNFDFLVAKMLERLTANQSNLKWNVPESFWYVHSVYDNKFFLSHGDFVKSWAGIPWYGLSRAYLKWRVLAADYGIDFDHLVIGHFHNPNIFTMVRGSMFVNGSLKGGDEYSTGAISAACDPVQLMFGVNPSRYGPTAIWHINSGSIR